MSDEALGGYLFFEVDDLDAAIELASRIPAARMGGAWRCARSWSGDDRRATIAELLRRLDRVEDARAVYDRALELVHSDAEPRSVERRAELLEAEATDLDYGWRQGKRPAK